MDQLVGEVETCFFKTIRNDVGAHVLHCTPFENKMLGFLTEYILFSAISSS